MKLYAEARRTFPNPLNAMDEGIVDIREDLSIETLLEAYSFGIFPWPHDGFPMLWFCPPQRGVLDFKDLHISKSLRRQARSCDWSFTANQAFDTVLEECARQPRPLQSGTWINRKLKEAYRQFHRAGYAQSVECWNPEGELIGGLYGVYVAGVFAGESMFYKVTGASKLTLLMLIDFLSSQGLTWMDCQMVTPHMEKLGAKYISRWEFLKRIEASKKQAQPIDFKSLGPSTIRDKSNLL